MAPWLPCLLLLLPLPPRVADDGQDEEPPDDRPEVEALLEELKEAVSAGREEGDSPAVRVIRTLAEEWPRSGEDDRERIVRGLDRVFLARRRPNRDGVHPTRLYRSAAEALGVAGESGAERLVRWIGHRRFDDDLPLQRELVLALGRTRSDTAVEELEDLLNEDRPEVLAAAVQAMGELRGKGSEVRKRLFESLLKTLESARENARGNDSTARAIWGAVRGPGRATLAKLAGARQDGLVAWRRWWNDNKRRDWDEPDDGGSRQESSSTMQ